MFTACDDVDGVIYNSNAGSNPTFLAFSSNVYTLPIERNSTGSVTVTLNSSTVSNVDRTYSIEVIPGTGLDAANPATYNVTASSITIPAGSYQGTLLITGQDNNLVDATEKTFSIRFLTANGESADTDIAQIRLFEVCALLDTFTGTYQTQQLTANLASALGPTFGNDTFVVQQGSNAFERFFEAEMYPAFGGLPVRTINMSFTCDGVFLSQSVNTGIGCSGNIIQLTRPTAGGPYTTSDDTVFELRYTENSTSSCGIAPRQTRVRFTKIN
ncbi:hypothetical protein CHU92_05935 [Flavobacterium cyanobacteriorum]|uniref:Calx-beta domain-containing protein n=1 Tax=Flavobacterium cyanobacteriorum TaxID=2022802 RepID=A0A255Z9W7_9FLAO|nr:hypothetical protein CHU92_05935 [Flavobacterium cyanobacteriorum]